MENYTSISETKRIIQRIVLLRSLMTRDSKSELNKKFKRHPIKELIRLNDLHDLIDPTFENGYHVVIKLKNERKTVLKIKDLEYTLSMCQSILRNKLVLN